ncbi:MAG: DUF4332 domain-containing protein [Candidatus Sericytochromatia bacterium]|nr:DUF4332 domain-containing protein [Candidatus Sericytochromatia bacterium]
MPSPASIRPGNVSGWSRPVVPAADAGVAGRNAPAGDVLHLSRSEAASVDLMEVLVTHPGHRAILARRGVTTPEAIQAWASEPWRRAAFTVWTGLPDVSLESYGQRYDMLRIPGITPGEVRLLHEAGIETAGHLAALGGDHAAAREGRSEFLRRLDLVRDQLARQASLQLRVPDEGRLIELATAAAGVESRIRSR